MICPLLPFSDDRFKCTVLSIKLHKNSILIHLTRSLYKQAEWLFHQHRGSNDSQVHCIFHQATIWLVHFRGGKKGRERERELFIREGGTGQSLGAGNPAAQFKPQPSPTRRLPLLLTATLLLPMLPLQPTTGTVTH